jgi:hypothetical protein
VESLGLRCLHGFIIPTVECREGFIARGVYVGQQGQQGQTRLLYDHCSFLTVHSVTGGMARLCCLTHCIYYISVGYSRINPKTDIVEKLTQIDANLTTRCKKFHRKILRRFLTAVPSLYRCYAGDCTSPDVYLIDTFRKLPLSTAILKLLVVTAYF